MKTKEGRKLGPKTLEEIRIRAVQRVQDGESPCMVKVIKQNKPLQNIEGGPGGRDKNSHKLFITS
jgi:hypothetical protein